ncbi:recombinase RecT [Mycolicibacterium sp. 3033]|nr:recombinase RecT [Mycolicibacterium aurantiacum]
MSAAQLGLEPGPLGEAHLVPFRDGKSGDYIVQFIPGYKGLVKLAWQSGQMADIWAEVVYENDEFDYTLGLNRDLVHKPARTVRGKPVYVYAVAKLKDGGTPFVVLAVEEVESIRSRSKAGKNGPWVTDWAAMAKKTAVKQLAKWLPLSSEFASAITLDGAVRTDVAPLVDVRPSYVEGEIEAADEQWPDPTPEAPESPEPDGQGAKPDAGDAS